MTGRLPPVRTVSPAKFGYVAENHVGVRNVCQGDARHGAGQVCCPSGARCKASLAPAIWSPITQAIRGSRRPPTIPTAAGTGTFPLPALPAAMAANAPVLSGGPLAVIGPVPCAPAGTGVLETVGQGYIDEAVTAGGVGGILRGDVLKKRPLEVERQRIAKTAVELGVEAA